MVVHPTAVDVDSLVMVALMANMFTTYQSLLANGNLYALIYDSQIHTLNFNLLLNSFIPGPRITFVKFKLRRMPVSRILSESALYDLRIFSR